MVVSAREESCRLGRALSLKNAGHLLGSALGSTKEVWKIWVVEIGIGVVSCYCRCDGRGSSHIAWLRDLLD